MTLNLAHSVPTDELTRIRERALLDKLTREVVYQALLKPRVITVQTDDDAMSLMEVYGLKSLPDMLTLIGLYQEWKGHPNFAGFKEVARPIGPLSHEQVAQLAAATRRNADHGDHSGS